MQITTFNCSSLSASCETVLNKKINTNHKHITFQQPKIELDKKKLDSGKVHLPINDEPLTPGLEKIATILIDVNTGKDIRKDQMRHLEPVAEMSHRTGGLTFNVPTFGGTTTHYSFEPSKEDLERLKTITTSNSENPVISQVGQTVTAKMGQEKRIPVAFAEIAIPDLHASLQKTLGSKGVMDMWIKQEGSNKVIIPNELLPLEPIIKEICQAEDYVNPQYKDWNMWLLVDSRPTKAGHTQRNAGYHYDGLNLGGKYKNTPLVSIYGWCNKLPTLFYTGNVEFPKDFDGTRDNASILAQRQVKQPKDVMLAPLNTVTKFDGACPHAGAVAEEPIPDRVFIRVCFTPPGVLFDRKGNTHNPDKEFDYSDKRWERSVPDPAVQWKNCTEFRSPQEFKNMWDVACQGHSAFSVATEGHKSHEHTLMTALRKTKGQNFLKEIVNLYDQDIQACRSEEAKDALVIKRDLLQQKFYL